MNAVIDPVCGIVRRVIPNWMEQGDPRIYAFGAVSSQASPLTVPPQIVHAGGAGLSKDQAFAATIGEAVERYCAAYNDPDEIIFASYDELRDPAVPPSHFCLYSRKQYQSPGFPYHPFTPKTRLSWTWAFSLQQNRSILVPASLVHLPLYLEDAQSETEIGPITSTGLACGPTLEEAILSAIAEVVERDALACFWMAMPEPKRTTVDPDSEIFEAFNKKFDLEGLQYYICDITSDLGVPTFLTILKGGSNQGAMINAGSAANLSPSRGCLKSLIEAAHGRPYVRFILQSQQNWRYSSDFSTVNTFQDHAAFYTRAPQHISALDLITNADPEKRLSDLPTLSNGSPIADICKYRELLAHHGFDILVKDLTTPDIEEIGLKVVRVLIPGLQLLHGDHRYPFLGCPRLYQTRQQAPRRDGIYKTVQSLLSEEDLNPFPHPLP